MDTFRVVLDGVCINGFEDDKVKIELARLIRQTAEVSAGLLAGQQTTIKSGIDESTGERYLRAFRDIGVACHIELETFDVNEISVTALPPSRQNAIQGAFEKTDRQDVPQLESSTRKPSFIIIFGGGFVAIMFVLAVALSIFAPTPKNSSSGFSFFKNEKIEGSAYQLIKSQLQSPSSFVPVSQSVLWQGKYKTRNAYIVKVEYDAQNGFGAMLRGCQYVAFSLENDKINWNQLFYLTDCFTGLTKEKEVELLSSVSERNFPAEEKPVKKIPDESKVDAPPSTKTPLEAKLEACFAAKIQAFRKERGEDAIVRHDMSEEWAQECDAAAAAAAAAPAISQEGKWKADVDLPELALGSCEPTSKTLFSCIAIQTGKKIELCDVDNNIKYSFGTPNKTPDLAFSVPKEKASTYQWEGIGRTESYRVNISNADTAYQVFWENDRLKSVDAIDGGVGVSVRGKTVAIIHCLDKTIVNNLKGVNLKNE